ncbi:MAG: DUF885 domain-containing protein [Candidatus Aminicenantales bacterium]
MKKKLISFVLGTFVFLFIGIVFPQANKEEAKFAKILETYFDEMWKFYPSAGTLAGYYKYNDKLEDLEAGNIEKRLEALDNFNKELMIKVNRSGLSPESQRDFELIRDTIELETLKHENIIPWDYNPIFYNDIILNSIQSLLTKNFAPLDARVKSATERAKKLPDLLKQARTNLKTPPQIFTETAIQQFEAILNFYRNEVPGLVENASADGKSKFQAEMAKVLAALEEYKRFLQNELRAKSTGNFRLGPEVHTRLLQLKGQSNLLLDELNSRADADYNNLRREMVLVCMPFYRIMYPNINMEALSTQYKEEDLRNIFIKGVLDKIKGDHVARGEYINRIRTSADEIKNFIAKNNLLEMPAANLAIEPMPAGLRGPTLYHHLTPPLYEADGSYICQIPPIPDEWTNEQAESFLEENNNFYLYFWTIKRVYPGPFFPLYFTRKNSSLVQKLYPNQPLIKGWPLCLEEMFINAGFGNYDLRLRLNQLKLMLKAVIDFKLELNIHQGTMTKEQAVAYMTRGGFQTPAEADRKWNAICLNPGEAAYAYIGFQEILDLEKEYRKLKGDAFDQKEFLQKLLRFGALTFRFLKTSVLQ